MTLAQKTPHQRRHSLAFRRRAPCLARLAQQHTHPRRHAGRGSAGSRAQRAGGAAMAVPGPYVFPPVFLVLPSMTSPRRATSRVSQQSRLSPRRRGPSPTHAAGYSTLCHPRQSAKAAHDPRNIRRHGGQICILPLSWPDVEGGCFLLFFFGAKRDLINNAAICPPPSLFKPPV